MSTSLAPAVSLNNATSSQKQVAGKVITKEKLKTVSIRPYPRVIFFYPLFIFSIVAYIIQRNQEINQVDGGAPISWLSLSWMIILFANLFAISFDFSTRKFFVWFLVIVIVSQTLAILFYTDVLSIELTREEFFAFNLNIESTFYLVVSCIVGVNLFFVLIEAQLNVVVINESKISLRNRGKEVYHRSIAGLKVSIEIIDIFKYVALGAGQIVIKIPGIESLKFDNVPFVKPKFKKLSAMIFDEN
jgi:hypothetical protein